ncbi:hypothetical protein AVDCRST_MAG81-190 [uncultured Synechococcales cyanobacterium]|uniref:Uncharacterized protein n=1 Tax=uncultured Synechococcales cyanobacterium TaxID=1936017 RepID=A0A6J4UQW5_9CYAN|nr:hypothetical protein AVDCRST_MAG81-190 [uncultured Synechococcales cyanobacterium]
MKPLQALDCYLLVTIHHAGRISTCQFREIACNLGTSITNVQRSLDFLVAAKHVRMTSSFTQALMCPPKG